MPKIPATKEHQEVVMKMMKVRKEKKEEFVKIEKELKEEIKKINDEDASFEDETEAFIEFYNIYKEDYDGVFDCVDVGEEEKTAIKAEIYERVSCRMKMIEKYLMRKVMKEALEKNKLEKELKELKSKVSH